jgi:hypothetical protein
MSSPAACRSFASWSAVNGWWPRHVLRKNEKGQREMPPGLTQTLLVVAIDLHDRQVAEAERWKIWIPVASALAAAAIASVTTLLALWLNG